MREVVRVVPMTRKTKWTNRVTMYATSPVGKRVTGLEIKQMMNEGVDIIFDMDDVRGKYKNNTEIYPVKILLSLIKPLEEKYNGPQNVDLLNRVIRQGGLTKYIQKLEGIK